MISLCKKGVLWMNEVYKDPKTQNVHYEAVRLFSGYHINPCDEILKVGDVAYLFNDSGKYPYVALILDLFETPKGKRCCRCRWFYRPSDIPFFNKRFIEVSGRKKGKPSSQIKIETQKFRHHPCELFLSDHIDINELKSVVKKCYVYSSNQDSLVANMVKDQLYRGIESFDDLGKEKQKKENRCRVIYHSVPWHICNFNYEILSNPSKFTLLKQDDVMNLHQQLSDPENCPRPFPVVLSDDDDDDEVDDEVEENDESVKKTSKSPNPKIAREKKNLKRRLSSYEKGIISGSGRKGREKTPKQSLKRQRNSSITGRDSKKVAVESVVETNEAILISDSDPPSQHDESFNSDDVNETNNDEDERILDDHDDSSSGSGNEKSDEDIFESLVSVSGKVDHVQEPNPVSEINVSEPPQNIDSDQSCSITKNDSVEIDDKVSVVSPLDQSIELQEPNESFDTSCCLEGSKAVDEKPKYQIDGDINVSVCDNERKSPQVYESKTFHVEASSDDDKISNRSDPQNHPEDDLEKCKRKDVGESCCKVEISSENDVEFIRELVKGIVLNAVACVPDSIIFPASPIATNNFNVLGIDDSVFINNHNNSNNKNKSNNNDDENSSATTLSEASPQGKRRKAPTVRARRSRKKKKENNLFLDDLRYDSNHDYLKTPEREESVIESCFFGADDEPLGLGSIYRNVGGGKSSSQKRAKSHVSGVGAGVTGRKVSVDVNSKTYSDFALGSNVFGSGGNPSLGEDLYPRSMSVAAPDNFRRQPPYFYNNQNNNNGSNCYYYDSDYLSGQQQSQHYQISEYHQRQKRILGMGEGRESYYNYMMAMMMQPRGYDNNSNNNNNNNNIAMGIDPRLIGYSSGSIRNDSIRNETLISPYSKQQKSEMSPTSGGNNTSSTTSLFNQSNRGGFVPTTSTDSSPTTNVSAGQYASSLVQKYNNDNKQSSMNDLYLKDSFQTSLTTGPSYPPQHQHQFPSKYPRYLHPQNYTSDHLEMMERHNINMANHLQQQRKQYEMLSLSASTLGHGQRLSQYYQINDDESSCSKNMSTSYASAPPTVSLTRPMTTVPPPLPTTQTRDGFPIPSRPPYFHHHQQLRESFDAPNITTGTSSSSTSSNSISNINPGLNNTNANPNSNPNGGNYQEVMMMMMMQRQQQYYNRTS